MPSHKGILWQAVPAGWHRAGTPTVLTAGGACNHQFGVPLTMPLASWPTSKRSMPLLGRHPAPILGPASWRKHSYCWALLTYPQRNQSSSCGHQVHPPRPNDCAAMLSSSTDGNYQGYYTCTRALHGLDCSQPVQTKLVQLQAQSCQPCQNRQD